MSRSGPSSSKSERERDRGPNEAGSGAHVRGLERRAAGAVQAPDRQDREADTANYHVRRDPAQDDGFPVLDARDRFRRRPDADRRNARTGVDLQPQGRRATPATAGKRRASAASLAEGIACGRFLPDGDRGPWVGRGFGDLREAAEDAGKPSRSSSFRRRGSSLSSPTR